ncbi:MAG: hypothetical protein JSR72_22785 [Proteobacteria bacterium]|nr:hypothetical protein [Pseudomonadota bacterium]
MIIGTRTLTWRDGERTMEIPISIYAPERETPGVWRCRYDVGWPEGLRVFAGYGVDAIQALVIALGMIGAELYSSSYHKSGSLVWDKPGSGYGFPVVPTLRDLLIGEDVKYL